MLLLYYVSAEWLGIALCKLNQKGENQMQFLSVLKQIEKVVNTDSRLKRESKSVKKYFIEMILDTYVSLENEEIRKRRHSRTENLKFSININLFDDFNVLLKEARDN